MTKIYIHYDKNGTPMAHSSEPYDHSDKGLMSTKIEVDDEHAHVPLNLLEWKVVDGVASKIE